MVAAAMFDKGPPEWIVALDSCPEKLLKRTRLLNNQKNIGVFRKSSRLGNGSESS